MNESMTTYHCKTCLTELTWQDERVDGIGWYYGICETCEKVICSACDGGTLDLGLVRDDQLNPNNDFQVFS